MPTGAIDRSLVKPYTLKCRKINFASWKNVWFFYLPTDFCTGGCT